MTKDTFDIMLDATLDGMKQERLRIVHLIKETALSEEHGFDNCWPDDCWCHNWLKVVEVILGAKSE